MNYPILITSWSISSLLTDILKSLDSTPYVADAIPGVRSLFWKFPTADGGVLILENRELQDEDAAFQGKKRKQVHPEIVLEKDWPVNFKIENLPVAKHCASLIDLTKFPNGNLKSHLKIRKVSNIAALLLELPSQFQSILTKYNFNEIAESSQLYHVLHLGPMSVDLILQFKKDSP